MADDRDRPRQGQWYCFWCEGVFYKRQLTDDHVLPAALGGDGRRGNIVRACRPCNTERGQIVCAHRNHRALAAGDPTRPNRDKAVRTHRRNLWRWLLLQQKWVAIERVRLGYSPTGEIDLTAVLRIPPADAAAPA